MPCRLCTSENLKLLKNFDFYSGYFCNDCGYGHIDTYHGSCCGNPNHINIQFEQSNGTWVQRVACKNCKSCIGGAKKKDKDFATYPKYTQVRFKEYESEKTAAREKLHYYLTKLSEIFKTNKNNLWWKQYSEYLKSPQWKEKRNLVLAREKYICQGCKQAEAVHAHHLSYENVGDELLFQLVALCVKCHNKLHPEKTL